MEVFSNSFQKDDVLPLHYTCKGTGNPPPLEWNNVPSRAKSLILICDDPDAPGGIAYHWGRVQYLSQDQGDTVGAHSQWISSGKK